MKINDSRSSERSSLQDSTSLSDILANEIFINYRDATNRGAASTTTDTATGWLQPLEIVDSKPTSATTGTTDHAPPAESAMSEKSEAARPKTIAELERDVEDLTVIEALFGAVAGSEEDEERAKEVFTKWLEKIPPEERAQRIRELNERLKRDFGMDDYELQYVEENGEITEVSYTCNRWFGPGLWIYGMYSFPMYEKEDA